MSARTPFSSQPILALSFLWATLLLCPFSAFATDYGSVLKDGVNLRSGPDTNKEVLWEVFKGYPLEVIDRKGKWLQVVDFEGDKGWLSASLLAKKKTVIVKANTVNIRVGAGKDYEIVSTAKYGVVFEPLEQEGDWLKVRHTNGTSGWVLSKLLWPN